MKRRTVRSSTLRNGDERLRIAALCSWFKRSARDLPWRPPHKRTGYTALVSEVMLQQTQVSRVVERYRAFMRRFPTVKALAAADAQDVLAEWQGMGYYNRARNLHRAAKLTVERYRGRVPRSLDELLTLPGVGRYTAGAIASIVHDQPEPIVDGNVFRVLSRWYARRGVWADRIATDWAWRQAVLLVESASDCSSQAPVRKACRAGRPKASASVFNEAMMELGATICTPQSPKCDLCPVAFWCVAHQRGVQSEIPAPRKRPARQIVHHHAVVMTHNGKVLIEQRPDGTNGTSGRIVGSQPNRLWAGLWQVPTVEDKRPLNRADLKRRLRIRLSRLIPAGNFEHSLTHRLIRFHVFRARPAEMGTRYTMRWHPLQGLDAIPMSNAQRKVLAISRRFETR